MAFEAGFGESKENNRRHRKWTWMDVEHITQKPAKQLIWHDALQG
jgi:hypothetical protein